MSRNLTVAVWGSNGAGTSTFSAALTLGLTKYFWNVFLVSGDKFLPAHDMWGIQSNVNERLPVESIGSILTYTNLTKEYIKERVIYHPEHRDKAKIGLMGYLVDDDCQLYNPISGNAAQSLLNEVKKLFQVTIVDCTLPQTDSLTEKALQYADIVITLLEPNAAGIGFVNAQSSFIRNNLSDGRRYIFMAAKVEPDSAVAEFEYRLGIRFDKLRLPYTKQAREKFNKLELFKKYDGDYRQTVDGIAERIMEEAKE